MRTLVVFEARSGLGVVPYVEGKSKRIFVDSPPQNIIDAARIAAHFTKKGKPVVAYGVVDGASLSYYDYNLPRTLASFLRTRFKREYVEEIAQFFQISPEDVLKHPGDSYVYWWWIRNSPLEVGIKEEYKELLLDVERARIPLPIREYFATNLVQKYIKIRESQIPADESILRLKKEIEKDLGSTSLNIIHHRIARYLFYLAFEHFKGNQDLLTIMFGTSPSQTIDEWSEIEKALDPIFMADNFGKAFKRLIASFSDLYEGYSTKHNNIVPLALSVDGYFTSSTLANIKKEYVEIRPRTPWFTVGKYKVYNNELLLHIRDKGKDGLIAIKYPLVILDHMLGILNKLNRRTVIKTSTYINRVAHQALENGKMAIEGILEIAAGVKDVDSVWFVEGDGARNPDGSLGEPRVNLMTGHAFDKALEKVSHAMGARYVRVISAPREDIEIELSTPQSKKPVIVSYRKMVEAAEKAGLIINNELVSF